MPSLWSCASGRLLSSDVRTGLPEMTEWSTGEAGSLKWTSCWLSSEASTGIILSLKGRRQTVPRWGLPCVTSTNRSVTRVRWVTCRVAVCDLSLRRLLTLLSWAGIHLPGGLPHTGELSPSPLLTSLQFGLTWFLFFSLFSNSLMHSCACLNLCLSKIPANLFHFAF